MAAVELDKNVLAEHEFYESGNLKNLLNFNYEDSSTTNFQINWYYMVIILFTLGLIYYYRSTKNKKKKDVSLA